MQLDPTDLLTQINARLARLDARLEDVARRLDRLEQQMPPLQVLAKLAHLRGTAAERARISTELRGLQEAGHLLDRSTPARLGWPARRRGLLLAAVLVTAVAAAVTAAVLLTGDATQIGNRDATVALPPAAPPAAPTAPGGTTAVAPPPAPAPEQTPAAGARWSAAPLRVAHGPTRSVTPASPRGGGVSVSPAVPTRRPSSTASASVLAGAPSPSASDEEGCSGVGVKLRRQMCRDRR